MSDRGSAEDGKGAGVPVTIKVHIRWMIRRDMPEVVLIDKLSFPEERQWGEEGLLRKLRQRNCIGMVAEVGESVLGFMVYELNEGHLHLLKLAVDPAVRRLGWVKSDLGHIGRYELVKGGVGTVLIGKLKGKVGGGYRRKAITIAVEEQLLGVQLWLRGQGFRCTGSLDGELFFTYKLAGEQEAEIPEEEVGEIDDGGDAVRNRIEKYLRQQ